MHKLDYILSVILKGEKLDEKYADHALMGKYYGFREYHIESDWLLVYSNR